MSRYTDGSEVVDAVAWTGDASLIASFLQDNPPVIDPKVLEDNPSATGVAELPDGRLGVYVGGDVVYEYAQLGDWLVRGADLRLRVIDQATFAASWVAVSA